MDSKNKVILLFVGLIFIVLFFGLYNLFGASLAPHNIKADNSNGKYLYTSGALKFNSEGKSLTQPQFLATSQSNPYYIDAGFKRLIEINYNATNIPINTTIRFCIIAKNITSNVSSTILCNTQNLQAESTAVWEDQLAQPILVLPGTNYFCNVELGDYRQESISQESISSSNADCKLTFDSISTNNAVYTIISANALTTLAEGTALVPNLYYRANKDIVISTLYSSISADPRLGAQKFTNICLNANESKYCLPDYAFNPQLDSHDSSSIKNISIIITKSAKFNFTCNTEQGKLGSCLIYAYIKIDPLELTNPNFTRRSLFSAVSEDIKQYCQTAQYYYQNDFSLTDFADPKIKLSRCEAILSSQDY